MSSVAHLVRRFAGSLSRRPPDEAEVQWAFGHLQSREASLWSSMAVQDRRHSLQVARRFVAAEPGATQAEVAAALLHDVGKSVAGLGTLGRVVATIIGPRSERLRAYHDHEALGAAMLVEAGSDPVTVELVQGRGRLAASLRAADDV
ncbi:MAG: hypothetical protein ACO3AV_03280 [Ilumatobacteraceae bacterium]|jgi:hypothetical protein